MSTIDGLINEILTLRKKNDPWEKKLLALVEQRTEQLTAEQKRELDVEIDKVDKRISENNQSIIEKEKQITADKERDAARAKFRAERVGLRISLRQVLSCLFGPSLRHTEYLISSPPLKSTDACISTGAGRSSSGGGQSSAGTGQSSLKRPTPIDTPYCTFSSISARAAPSPRADSSNSSPSSDSDCGVEMKSREIQSQKSLGLTKNEYNSSLRHRIKDKGQEGSSTISSM